MLPILFCFIKNTPTTMLITVSPASNENIEENQKTEMLLSDYFTVITF